MKSKNHLFNNLFRLILVVAALGVQCWWFLWLADLAQHYAPWIKFCYQYVPLIIVLYIYNKNTNSAFKMPWMILIIAFPLFGVCMYLLLGHHNGTPGMRRKYAAVSRRFANELPQSPEILRSLRSQYPRAFNQARYLSHRAGFPVYGNTSVHYYEDPSPALEAQLESLKSARKYIFIEYYAIQVDGIFEKISDILKEKVREGVDVYIIYDDLGSYLFQGRRGFSRKMEEYGIHCRWFNPVLPFLNVFMGNRDHRKIMVIDGVCAYTGGYNLADEYFHVTSPYGWWKDTGVKIEGEAVRSFVIMFLEMWNLIDPTETDAERFLPAGKKEAASGEAFVIPYGDSPLDDVSCGEEVYMNVIRSAEQYVYISTPYLILTDEMILELISAAERGVDVRIVVPGRPDKHLVYAETMANFRRLVLSGVRIYRYSRGFNHAKQFVSDNTTSVVGTINMDFRSFYHHFEDAALIFDTETAETVAEDMRQMFAESSEVTPAEVSRFPLVRKIADCILRLIAPIM